MTNQTAPTELEVVADPQAVAQIVAETTAFWRDLALQSARAENSCCDCLPLLCRFREDVVSALISVVRHGDGHAAANAWRLLNGMNDASALAILAGLLPRLATDELLLQLIELSHGRRYREPIPEALSQTLVQLMDSPDKRIRLYAAGSCASLQVPGILERVSPLIPSLGMDSLAFLSHCLAKSNRTAEMLGAIATRLSQLTDKQPPFDIYAALAEFVESGEPVVAAKAIHVLAELMERDEERRSWGAPIRALLRHGGAEVVPVLKLIAERGKWHGLREEALGCIGRIVGLEAVPYLLEHLLEPEVCAGTALAIGLAAKGSQDANLVARLAEAATQAEDEDVWEVASGLTLIGGIESRNAASRLLDRITPFRRVGIEWYSREITLERAVDAAVACGLLAQAPSAEQVAAIRRWRGIYDLDYIVFFSLLELEGATGDVFWLDNPKKPPAAHDDMLETLAACSRGVFRPEAVRQFWHQAGDAGGDYTVQFVHGNRLYRFRARNYGPVYDSAAVLNAVHRALEDAGRTERFLPLHWHEQGYMLIFAESAKLDRMVRELALPVLEDFSIFYPGDAATSEAAGR